MNEFGPLLRNFRQDCWDPDDSVRRLSQERLGELLGKEMGMQVGYSGAAVSDWERGKSKIHADQRKVLVGLIRVLHDCGGIKTLADANRLLNVGNYRALNRIELESIPLEIPDSSAKGPTPKSSAIQRALSFLLEGAFLISSHELQSLISDAKEGPKPFWPRVLVSLIQRSTDHLSATDLIRPVIWVWVWLLTWRLISPSLDWPFTNKEVAKAAISLYTGGSIVIPLLIGALTDTEHDEFWKEHNLADNLVTRLYTYQGAGVGFHLGYFGIFTINLLWYYIKLQFALWTILLAVAVILMLGYAGARLVPYNLWRAFGRLELADGRVFFVFILVGPSFGFFFFEYYEILLGTLVGGLSILLTITLFIYLVLQRKVRGKPG